MLTILIALAGIGLLVMLFMRLSEANKIYKIQRETGPGFSDLLHYASMIEPGILLCKNGALMAGFTYKGRDNDNQPDEDLEHLSAVLNKALTQLDSSGYVVHIDTIRMEAPKYNDTESYFPDRVTAAIEEERKRFFEDSGNVFEASHFITITYLPPLMAEKKFKDMMFTDEGNDNQRDLQAEIVDQFKRQLSSFETSVSQVLDLQRLGAYTTDDDIVYDDFLEYIQFCITGRSQRMKLPYQAMFLDYYLGGIDVYTGVTPLIGNKYVCTISIDDFPTDCYPSMLSTLADLPINCRVNTRYLALELHQAEAVANAVQKKWNQKKRGFISSLIGKPETEANVNRDAMRMANDASDMLNEIRSGVVAYGYYNCTVLLMEEDRHVLEAQARIVEKRLMQLGFVPRIEDVNTFEAYLGSLPGNGTENLRRYFLNTINIADLMPTSTVYTGSKVAPCPFYPYNSPPLMHCLTDGNTPYRLNFHVGDVGHTAILGPTGAGKSTLIAEIAAQFFRYKDATVFAFDKGNSLFALCKAAGGNHINIAGESDTMAFAPFNFIDTDADRAWLVDWVDKTLELNNIFTTPQERTQIADAINVLYKNKKRDLEDGKPVNISITNFLGQLQNHHLSDALAQYDIGGVAGRIMAAEKDGLAFSRFNVFEMESLMELGDKFVIPVLDYLFRRIQMSLKGQPTMIILDECWLFFKHPTFARKIIEWLKVLRKANCIVVMATQSLNDVFESETLLNAVVESTASKIFLPNAYANQEEVAKLYKRFGLNNQQIKLIATSIPKKHYYHYTQKGSRLFDLALGPVALSFVAVSDPGTISDVKKVIEEYGDKWPDKWLEMRKLNINDYLRVA